MKMRQVFGQCTRQRALANKDQPRECFLLGNCCCPMGQSMHIRTLVHEVLMTDNDIHKQTTLEYPESEDSGSEEPFMSEDTATDYITGHEVKDSPKERVRQRIVRALFHEYGLAVEDMASDFPIPVDVDGKRRRKKVEVAIFEHEKEHTLSMDGPIGQQQWPRRKHSRG